MVDFLGLPAALCCIDSFVFVSTPLDPDRLTLVAIAVYSVFRATHALRNAAPSDGQEEVSDCLHQFCLTATIGHTASARRLHKAIARYHHTALPQAGRSNRSPRFNTEAAGLPTVSSTLTTSFVQGGDHFMTTHS